MTRKKIAWIFGVSMGLMACESGGNGTGAPVPCTSGSSQACACADGSQGAQTCGASGTWEACVCGGQCTPDCAAKVCGDDGCGGTCGPGCGADQTCGADGQCVSGCTPDCDGRVCGDDGCGGTCGPGCGSDTTCSTSGASAGQCIPTCTPACAGKVCGPDGCGGTCGTGCADGETCNASQTGCEASQACTALTGSGPLAPVQQGVFSTQGVAPPLGGAAAEQLQFEFFADDTGTFDLAQGTNTNYSTCNQCVRVFEDVDASGGAQRVFFQTGGTITVANDTPPVSSGALSITVTDLALVEVTIADGSFVSSQVPGGGCLVFPGVTSLSTPACEPQCGGKQCGPDGCGGACGVCGSEQTCTAAGQCEGQCTPACSGVCGPDGCGGQCGTCGAGQMCESGQCVCEPQCADNGMPRFCGDDACGGSCGTCGNSYVCSNPGDTTTSSSCVCADDPVTLAYDASGLPWGQGSPTLYMVRGTIKHSIGAGVVLSSDKFEIRATDADKTGSWVGARGSGSDCDHDEFAVTLTHYVYDDGQTVECGGPGVTVHGSSSFVVPAPPAGCTTNCNCPVELQ